MSHSYVIRPSGVTTRPSRPTIPSNAATTCPPNAIAPAVYPSTYRMSPPSRTEDREKWDGTGDRRPCFDGGRRNGCRRSSGGFAGAIYAPRGGGGGDAGRGRDHLGGA